MNRILRTLIPLVVLFSLIAACVNPVTGEYMPPLFVSPTPTPTVDPALAVAAPSLPTSTPVPPPMEEAATPTAQPVQEAVAENVATEEPVAEEPVMVEPISVEPISVEPVAVELKAVEPVVVEPVAEEPVVDEPVADAAPPAQIDPDSPFAAFVVDDERISVAALGLEVTRPDGAWFLVDAAAMGIDFGGMQPLAMLYRPAAPNEDTNLDNYVTFATIDVPDFSIRALYQILQADPETGLEMLAEEMGDAGENAQITQVGPFNAVLVSALNPMGDPNYLWIVVRPSAAIYILAEGFSTAEEVTELIAAHTDFLPLAADETMARDLLPDPDADDIGPEEQRTRLVTIAEQARGLESQDQVAFNFMDEAALRAVLVGDELPSDDELRQSFGEERMLKLLGLIPEDVDLTALVLDLYQSEIAGYYDEETDEFVLIEEPGDGEAENGEAESGEAKAEEEARLDLMAQITFVHEYVHALQDQTFDLARFSDDDEDAQPERTDDATLAIRAMVEGDAQFATSLYIIDYVDLVTLYKLGKEESISGADGEEATADATPSPSDQAESGAETEALDVETEVGMEGEVNTDLLDEAPNFVRESMIFPYVSGELFILAVYDELGWDGVNAIWTNPPVSTEQILHPALYPDDVPTPVELPTDLADRLSMGTETLWQEYVRNVWGEFQLRTMLAERVSESKAARGADGWDGDQFAFLSDGTTEVVVLSTVWDSAGEALQARTVLRDWLESSGYSPDATRRYTLPGDPEDGSPARHVFLTSASTAVYFLLSTDAAALDVAVNALDWE